VHWRANKKAWMTGYLFKDWFFNCFIPEVEAYIKDINPDFKVLLLVDNAPGHPKDLHHPNVTQHNIDQGIIATFRVNYISRTFQAIY
jgi:hypothetical protein